MREEFIQQLNASEEIHIPLPIDESETNEVRLLQKPVLESRLIDDMESLDAWQAITPWATVELSDEVVHEGTHSVKFTHPTNLKDWPHPHKGRIYAVPSAMRVVDHEDWREYNRLSVWVYPIADGMKSITIRLQLHNEGERVVPDVYERDGAHNVSVKNREWNHIVLEMPYLNREDVTGVSLDYDMVGHEPEAADHIVWYLDKLELQKVEADNYETWIPMPGKISFSGSGYQTGATKIAILSDEGPREFKLVETKTGKVVLKKAIEDVDTAIGKLRVLDFTEVMTPGDYILIAGEITTRVFEIGDTCWETSLWKTLNFFLVLRCGYEVPGKHRACHTDMRLVHGDQSIIANGGWHDAADLAQGLYNTAEATSGLLALAYSLKGKNERLYKRVLEEAKWGLDYVVKTRFDDGWRSGYSSTSIWTDGVIGTDDDIISTAVKSSYNNFDCAYAEALGYRVFKDVDEGYANYVLKIAKEDFRFGVEFLKDLQTKADDMPEAKPSEYYHWDYNGIQVNSLGSMAASELYRVTGDPIYKERAFAYTDYVLACQQQEFTDWDVPMVGFFYQDTKRDLIYHNSHMSYSCMPDIALRNMCEVFPDDAAYMKWYHALVLSGEYYQAMSKYTAPYGVVPAGVYHEDEMEDHCQKVLMNHNQVIEEDYYKYKIMVRKGFPMGKGYYLRVYPVWFSFRGNYHVLLCESKSMNCAAAVRNNYALYDQAQNNYQWIVGKNPFAQSTMFGEGYDYVQLYAVQPGQTVGALSVGMQSKFEEDVPYWPQVNTATYKEVWVCPPTKWMWCMADDFLPASVNGYLKPVCGQDKVTFTHQATGKVYSACVHARTGRYELTLPAGVYTMEYAGLKKTRTFINGKTYELDGALYEVVPCVKQEGNSVEITLKVTCEDEVTLKLQAENLCTSNETFTVPAGSKEYVISKKYAITDEAKPWVAIITPEHNPADRIELLDTRF